MTRTARARASIAITALAAGLLVTGGATPAAAAACTLEQITDHTTGSVDAVAMNADGTRMVISGSASLDGNPNPGNNPELWLYDTVADSITRLTNTASGINFTADIDDAGTHVAFASQADIGGGNADENQEIYLWTAPSTITQITSTTAPTGQANPDLDGSGDAIAYTSNVDGNFEIYVHDVGVVGPDEQATVTASAASGAAVFNRAGTELTFTSNASGRNEVFIYTRDGGILDQVTDAATGSAFSPRFNAPGTRITFTSTRNIGGGNADGSPEVFQRVRGTGVTTRLTSGPALGATLNPRTNAAGTRVVFNDSRDPTGGNGDGTQEVFARDVGGSNNLTQVTSSALDSPTTSDINDAGTRIALVSRGDPSGDNADGSTEVFLATCGSPVRSFTDVAYGNAFFDQIEWMTETGIASGFPGGLFKPTEAVKRQQMANFLYNLAGQPAYVPPGTPTFSDVPVSNPFFLQIEWMNATGVASGFPGGLFKPTATVKRQQMANFLYNLADQPGFTPPVTPTYSDVPTSNPFYLQVEWMASEEIASGFPDGSFHPLDAVKRQQMANFVFNFATCCEVNV